MKLLCGGAYAKFDDMLWHLPGNRLGEIAWKMIHGTPTKEELLLFAGVLECYRELVRMPEPRRRKIVRRLREAMQLDAEGKSESRS